MNLKLKQTLPLALLYAADDNEIRGKTRMTKLAFLLEERLAQEDVDLEETIDYDFYPYDYGPFSKELLEDLEMFDREGAVDISTTPTFGSTRTDYKLTSPGISAFEDSLDNDMRIQIIYETSQEVIEEFGSYRIRDLLDFIYNEYPQYRENSVYY